MLTDMDVDLFIRIITALAAGALLATPAIRLWKWNSTLSIRGAALLILAGGALLFMASDKPGFLEAQSLKIQLAELEDKVNELGSIASRTAETAAVGTSALQQRVGSLQTKINALEGLGTNVALAQKRQAARLETLLLLALLPASNSARRRSGLYRPEQAQKPPAAPDCANRPSGTADRLPRPRP